MQTRVVFFVVAIGLWTLVGTLENKYPSGGTLLGALPNSPETDTRVRYKTSVSTLLDSLRRSRGPERTAWARSASRGRRAAQRRGKQVLDDRGVYRVTSVQPLFPLCSHSKHVSWTEWRNTTYAVCVSNQNTATIGRLSASGWSPLDEWAVPQGVQSVTFHYNDVLYAVIADRSKGEGADLLRFNADQSRMDVDHTIHSRYATAVTLWKMHADEGNYHLAIANSHGPESEIYLDRTYTYDWRGTYFDHYDSVQSYDVRDLEAFHVYGQAYLAVANHKTDKDTYDVDSQIFLFDAQDWRWKNFQKIRTQAVADVHFFTMGPDSALDFFLVFANQFEIKNGHRNYAVKSDLYKFVGNRFVPFQCLETHGASGVGVHSDPRTGAFLLAVSNVHSSVQLFQYDGWTFVSAPVQFTAESMGPGAQAMVFHPWNDKLTLIVTHPRKENEDNVFALSFVNERPVGQWNTEAFEWCKQAEQRLNLTRPSEMTKTLDNACFRDSNEPLFLETPVIFQGGLSVKQELQTPKFVDLHDNRILDYSLLFQLESLEQRLQGIKNRIEHLKSVLQIAMRTEGQQVVTGHLEFDSLSASCRETDCEITAVVAEFLNDVNIANLPTRVLFVDKPNMIIGSLKFEELHVEGHINVLGFVDGVNSSHVVTKHTTGKIYDEKKFAHDVVATDVNIQGTLDGVRIDPGSILLTEGDQEVYGEVTFTEVELEDIHVEGKVTGVNLQEFYEDVVLVGGGVQLVSGPKVLKGPVTLRDLHLQTGKVNGVDLVDLWNAAVWLDTDQTVQGLWNFSHLALVDPAVATINGVQIPSPEVVTRGPGDLIIPGHQVFAGDLFVESLEVDLSLNGLNRIQGEAGECPNQLDLVLKSCDQTILGAKTFVSTVLNGRNFVTGKINNFDLKKLEDHLNHRTVNITDNWVFNQVEIRAPVLVKEDLVGWEVEQLYHRALKIDQSLPANARVAFKNKVQVERLKCDDVNGVDVEKDLFLRHGPAVVTSKKNWENLLLLENSKVLGKINGFDINFLNDVLRNGPHVQVLLENRIVEGDLILNNLELGGKLSGLDLSKAIRLNSDLIFNVPMELENAGVSGDLVAGNIVVSSGIVNGLNFNQLLNDTMIYSLPQRVLGKKTIRGDLIVPEGADLDVDSVNGKDMKSLQRDTVYQDQAQVVTGKKTFVRPVRFHNLIMNGSINGVGVWDIFNNWMLQDTAQTVTADVTFGTGLKVNGDMTVSGLVNGINLEQLQNDVVRTPLPFQFNGDLQLKDVRVQGDVVVSGKVQGVDLSEEAVRMFSDNLIGGRKSFKNVLVDGDLFVDGPIGGVDVVDLCKFVARSGQPLVLDEVVVRGNLEISGHLQTEGPVNDLNLENFKDSVVMLNESHHFNNVFFEELVFEQPVDVRGTLNGVDIQRLGENYMSLSKDQKVYSKTIFKGFVTIDGPVHAGHVTAVDNVIGSVNIRQLSESILTRHGQQIITGKVVIQGNLHFLNDLQVSSDVNGLRIPEDIGLKIRPNVVSGPLVFSSDLVVSTDLDLLKGATVQGVDVSEWASNTVMVTGHFTLTGVKKFRDLHVADVRALDRFGGTFISETTILLNNRKQVVKGKVSFGGTVQVRGSLNTSSEINGVLVPKLLTESVLKNRPAVVTGRKVFLRPLTIRRLSTTGFVSTVNLTELALLIERPYDLEVLQSNLTESHQAVTSFSSFLSDTPHRLNYYENWFKWDDSVILAWTLLSFNDTTRFLLVSRRTKDNPDCSTLLIYSLEERGPVETATLPSSYTIALEAFVVGSKVFLAVSNVHDHCVAEAGGVDVFEFDSLNGLWKLKQKLTGLVAQDFAALSSSPFLPCLASAVTDNILIHCFNRATSFFDLSQTIPLAGVHKVSFASCQEGLFLAGSYFQDGVWSVQVYSWSGQSMVPVQNMPAFYPVADPVLIGTTDKLGQPVCLLVIAEGSFDKRLVFPTTVYRFDNFVKKFVADQRLDVRGVLDVQWDKTNSGDLLTFFLTGDGVHSQIWRGYSGFQPHDFFHFPGGRNILGFGLKGWHHLAVSGLVCDATCWPVGPNANAIFKSKIKGL